jgi:hypothetical protein
MLVTYSLYYSYLVNLVQPIVYSYITMLILPFFPEFSLFQTMTDFDTVVTSHGCFNILRTSDSAMAPLTETRGGEIGERVGRSFGRVKTMGCNIQ